MSLDATETLRAAAFATGPRILMTPDYRRDNPYQALLAGALEDLGASVAFPRGYRQVLPLRRMLGQDGRRPDVLHLHWLAPYLRGRSAVTKSAYALRLLLDAWLVRRAGVRLVWTVHNLVEHEQTHPAIELWCRRRLARLADAVIVHSERARRLVAESHRIPASRIEVIPHGHYRDVYGPPIPATEARRRLGLPPEGRVFLFFGMIRPYKGVLPLIAAWARTPALHARHSLVVAGAAPDPDHAAAVRAAAAGVPNLRLRLEHIPEEEVSIYLSAADTVVLPFERALTSGSLALAESFGRAVIASPAVASRANEAEAAASAPDPDWLARALLERAAGPDAPAHPSLADWASIARLHGTLYARGRAQAALCEALA